MGTPGSWARSCREPATAFVRPAFSRSAGEGALPPGLPFGDERPKKGKPGVGEGRMRALIPSGTLPCIWTTASGFDGADAARALVATRALARRTAPALPPATTVDEHWARRRCRTRPNSRLAYDRMDKAGYRDKDLLWSGCLQRKARRSHRP